MEIFTHKKSRVADHLVERSVRVFVFQRQFRGISEVKLYLTAKLEFGDKYRVFVKFLRPEIERRTFVSSQMAKRYSTDLKFILISVCGPRKSLSTSHRKFILGDAQVLNNFQKKKTNSSPKKKRI